MAHSVKETNCKRLRTTCPFRQLLLSYESTAWQVIMEHLPGTISKESYKRRVTKPQKDV